MAAAVFALSACHSELDNQPDGKVNTAKQITFKVNFEDYNADEEVQGTRALAPDTLSKQVIDLDNNLLAEVSIQRDTTKTDRATTRALSDGTYTMLAYQGSTLKGEVTGTVNNGEFYVTGTPMVLAPGTYDFVLYSDLTRSGNTFIVDRSNMSNAQIGRTTGVVITSQLETQEVVFNLKHLGARMKIKLTGYMPYPAMSATLSSVNATSVPNQVVYDAVADSWTGYTHAALSENCTFPASEGWKQGVWPHQDDELNYQSTSNEYCYFLPTTDASKLRLVMNGGQIYNTNLAQHHAGVPLSPDPAVVMGNNKSYIINVKLRPNYLYLMSNGDVDFLSSTPYTLLKKADGTPLYRDKQGNVLTTPKVPIGMVVSQSRRLAISLKDIGNGQEFAWTTINNNQQPGNKKVYGDGTQWQPTAAEKEQMLADMDGYNYTWDGASSYDGRVKANEPTLYPVFYKAAHYRDELIAAGITLSGAGAGNWYLPSAGEYFLAMKALGFIEKYSQYYDYYIASAALDFGLTHVGGMEIGTTFRATGTQYVAFTYVLGPGGMGSRPGKNYEIFSAYSANGRSAWTANWDQNIDLKARAFIKY